MPISALTVEDEKNGREKIDQNFKADECSSISR